MKSSNSKLTVLISAVPLRAVGSLCAATTFDIQRVNSLCVGVYIYYGSRKVEAMTFYTLPACEGHAPKLI